MIGYEGFFIDENDKRKAFGSQDVFDYHGTSLIKINDRYSDSVHVFEPAYGIDISGKPFSSDISPAALDSLSENLDSCRHEGNYLGDIAFNIIANDRHVKNPDFNKPFQEKVEALRRKILSKLRRGVAVAVAFAAVACASPKLSAESSLTVKTVGMAQYDNPVVYYAENNASDVITLEDFTHMLNEDAKTALKQAYPRMKETDKKFKGLLESTIKTFCDSSSGYLEKKFGSARFSVEDIDSDYTAFFFKDSGILLSSAAVEYKTKVSRDIISPDLELSGNTTKINLETGRGR